MLILMYAFRWFLKYEITQSNVLLNTKQDKQRLPQ